MAIKHPDPAAPRDHWRRGVSPQSPGEPHGATASPEGPADWRGSVPAGRGAHGGCRGKAFGDVAWLLGFSGAVGMCKTYHWVFRGRIKGREREGSRWTGEEPA